MKKIVTITLIFVTSLFLASCNGTGGSEASNYGRPTTPIESGATDVGVDQSYQVSFGGAVIPTTVTSDTFYLAPTNGAAASVVKGEAVGADKAFNVALCDSDNAVAANIVCEGTDAANYTCFSDVTCTLTPEDSLDYSQTYVLCATPEIEYACPGLWGNFPGLSVQFTTSSGEGDKK
jgi:hypothetical protein